MRIGILTREYPPEVYGGAGVHVDFLVRELEKLADVDVHCMGAPRDGAVAHSEHNPLLADANPAIRTLAADLAMADQAAGCDIVHSHTWYANMGGHLAKLLHDIPHVVTSHSLEPQRPWKAEQLGGGYRVSSWAEQTAYEAADAVIAVSHGSKQDVMASYPSLDEAKVHVVHNGIDTTLYRPDPATDVLERLGVDPARPSVVFVGRITRQKGVPHLLRAALQFDESAQLVLLAGAADTPELEAETDEAVAALRASRDAVHLHSEMLPREDVRQVLTHGTVFVCPSVYEPLGIVNLEAMACETAVVASDVGGIPEVVDDGKTGLLVHYDEADTVEFEAQLAAAVNQVLANPDRAQAMGVAGRERAVTEFGWDVAARRTMAIYESVL
ncbi:MAG: glycogen synthase [Ilumatobacter sp.]|uniref:glycogen synthase n=1 Tax=Ilumatobacter sp. TaxID=1967498 RepID=UPI0026092655|nr:glycogen synthase [Ilumatobacter sp.]MDJ0769750.1 glycogen synthase [Ilumatobacter sp.]